MYDVVCSAVYALIMGVLGAKVLFLIVSMPQVIEAFKLVGETIPGTNDVITYSDVIIALIKGGFVFYGGFIGGALGLFIYVKQFKMDLGSFAGFYAVVLPLGHAIGRIGCFLGGCCYGIEYDGPFSYTYPEGVLKYTTEPVGVPRFPVQLFEALCLFILFAVLIIIYYKVEKHNLICTITYALGYAVIRFSLEFLRGDVERGGIGPISTSQLISLIIFAIALTSLILTIVSEKKKAKMQTNVDEISENSAEEAVVDVK